jgi:hypothetical protein
MQTAPKIIADDSRIKIPEYVLHDEKPSGVSNPQITKLQDASPGHVLLLTGTILAGLFYVSHKADEIF